jgi:4-carboxymuconolactone decarboxylase
MASNHRPSTTLPGIVLAASASLGAAAQERLPPIPTEQLTAEQSQALEAFRAGRGAPTGPWNVLLRSPEVMTRARALSDYLRFGSALPPRLSELLILLTARQWTQNYIWSTHYDLATKGGLDPATAQAIADGRRPEKLEEDEAILYDFFTELQRGQSVSDATYARALEKFGEQGIVDATSIMGYYTMVAMILNVARTPLRGDATPALTPYPR